MAPTASPKDLTSKLSDGSATAAEQTEALLAGAQSAAAGSAELINLRNALIDFYMTSDVGDGGLHVRGRRDYERALYHAHWLFRAMPGDGDIALRLCSLLAATGRNAESLRLYGQLRDGVRGQGLEVNIMYSMARVHYYMGEFEASLALFNEVIERAEAAFKPPLGEQQRAFLGLSAAWAARILTMRGAYDDALALIGALPFPQRIGFLARTEERALRLRRGDAPSGQTGARPTKDFRLAVTCVKYGDKYPPDYVNRLFHMVRRNLSGDWPFYCMTERPEGLDAGIRTIDISGRGLTGWWSKIALFDPQLPVDAEALLYLDLDSVVIGDLDFIWDLPIGFQIFEHSMAPSFNSSVMLFDRSVATPLFDSFSPEAAADLLGDQDWIEVTMPHLDTFPFGLIRHYRVLHPDLDVAALKATDTRFVTFPTSPKPHQVTSGWVPELWR